MNEYLTHSYWIGKFTDNELSPEDEERILSQASHNPVLRNELRLDRDISMMFDDSVRLKLSEQIRKTMMDEKEKVRFPLFLKIAASVLILVSFTSVFYLAIRSNYVNYAHIFNVSRPFSLQRFQVFLGFGNDKENLAYTPAGRRDVKDEAYDGSSYTPRPEYEYLVGAATRDASLYMISPGPRVSCTRESTLQFSWRWINGAVPVAIEICNNKGKLILKNLNTYDASYMLNTGRLGRGLFYYKITTGENLVTMGSISVF